MNNVRFVSTEHASSPVVINPDKAPRRPLSPPPQVGSLCSVLPDVSHCYQYGVCLFPQAPLVFLSKRLHSQKEYTGRLAAPLLPPSQVGSLFCSAGCISLLLVVCA